MPAPLPARGTLEPKPGAAVHQLIPGQLDRRLASVSRDHDPIAGQAAERRALTVRSDHRPAVWCQTAGPLQRSTIDT